MTDFFEPDEPAGKVAAAYAAAPKGRTGPPVLQPAPGLDMAAILAEFGTPCVVPGVEKATQDLARYEAIIDATKPEVIVETGTRRGHSAVWFAGRVSRVITIDSRPDLHTARQHPRVLRVPGNSTAPAILGRVARLTAGLRTLVSLDSDHSRAHVAEEIRLYSELVTAGSYLVVEDGVYHFLDRHEYDGDPLEAIAATVALSPLFTRDLDIEGMYPITGAIAGWWRRAPFTCGGFNCPVNDLRRCPDPACRTHKPQEVAP